MSPEVQAGTAFLGTVAAGKNGVLKVVWQDPGALSQRLQVLAVGQRVVVTLDPLRGNDLNAAYRKMLTDAAPQVGTSANELHEDLKRRFLLPDAKGEYHSRNLSEEQFRNYFMRCSALLMEYGVAA